MHTPVDRGTRFYEGAILIQPLKVQFQHLGHPYSRKERLGRERFF